MNVSVVILVGTLVMIVGMVLSGVGADVGRSLLLVSASVHDSVIKLVIFTVTVGVGESVTTTGSIVEEVGTSLSSSKEYVGLEVFINPASLLSSLSASSSSFAVVVVAEEGAIDFSLLVVGDCDCSFAFKVGLTDVVTIVDGKLERMVNAVGL